MVSCSDIEYSGTAVIVRNGLFEMKTGPEAAVKTGAWQCGDNWTESAMTATLSLDMQVEIGKLIVPVLSKV